DDAAQEVFLVAIHRLADIRPGAEKGYLLGTAVRVAHVLRRKHSREELLVDPDDERVEPATLSTPEDSMHQMQEHALLMQLLDGLPDDLRTVFVLYEIEGESLASIAAMLDIPQGTATSRLRRAREKFDVRITQPRGSVTKAAGGGERCTRASARAVAAPEMGAGRCRGRMHPDERCRLRALAALLPARGLPVGDGSAFARSSASRRPRSSRGSRDPDRQHRRSTVRAKSGSAVSCARAVWAP
ncbi:MAG: polymerase sigma factor RpoE, partial [Labilithrix sp.]|nr:polymerase sigma factor RpoE [Labilithrix sp.]